MVSGPARNTSQEERRQNRSGSVFHNDAQDAGSLTRRHRKTHTKTTGLGSLILHQLPQPEYNVETANELRRKATHNLLEMRVTREGRLYDGQASDHLYGLRRPGL